MALGEQIPGQLVTAAVIVIQQAGKIAEVAVSAMEEQNGGAPVPELQIQVAVGGGQGGFGTFDENGTDLLLQKLGQDVPFPADFILRSKDQCGIARLGKAGLEVVQNGGEDVVVQKGGDNGDLAGVTGTAVVPDIGTAALAALDKTLCLQQLQRVADGLAAHVVTVR